MKYAIRYYSKSGNTKKLANTLSEIINVPALDITNAITEDTDVLFFGSGVYGCALDPAVIKYLSNIEVKIGTLINFSTSGIMESNYDLIKDVLKNTNIDLSENEFHCPGSFVTFNNGRPNDNDLSNFNKFILETIE
jgi:flavodoxin